MSHIEIPNRSAVQPLSLIVVRRFNAHCEPICTDGKLCSPTGLSGVSSAVERELPKLDVTGSIPVPRSKVFKQISFRQGSDLFPRQGSGKRVGWTVRVDGQDLAVVIKGLRLVA